MNVVVLTGMGWRHRYVANCWFQRLNVVGVIGEKKRPVASPEKAADGEVVVSHYRQRDQAEARWLAEGERFQVGARDLLVIEKGQANSREVFDWIRARNPELVLLFGSTIITDPLLGAFQGRIVNMHLGLSPYYRGAATNFWPLVFNQPECAGVTIHVPVARVDAGPILIQGRPALEASDGCHDIGCKAIRLGAELMPEGIRRLLEGRLSAPPDPVKGRLFKRTDFTAESVLTMRQNVARGMVPLFLREQNRLERYPIVE